MSFDATFLALIGPEKGASSFERQEARKLYNRLLVVIPVVNELEMTYLSALD